VDALLDNPLALGAAAAVVLLGLAALRRRGAAGKAEEIPGLDALIAAGKYDDAATLALEHQRPRVAIELLLRGQRVARAAGIAAREGDLRLAGELYDRAEDFERAAHCYERAGMNGPAQESRAKLPAAVPKQPAPAAPAPVLSLDDAARAAEERLGAGDIEAAAQVYRDAGMLDEAVHLFANVLGLPGEAAPLVAKLGNAERAAELYEIAGMRPEAARVWAEVARALRRPEDVALRVVRLDPAVGLALLEDLARVKPLAGEGVTIHFELAMLLAEGGEVERAGDLRRHRAGARGLPGRGRAAAGAARGRGRGEVAGARGRAGGGAAGDRRARRRDRYGAHRAGGGRRGGVSGAAHVGATGGGPADAGAGHAQRGRAGHDVRAGARRDARHRGAAAGPRGARGAGGPQRGGAHALHQGQRLRPRQHRGVLSPRPRAPRGRRLGPRAAVLRAGR
jgi:tetratricopeptide (TPR) repeat protein